MNQPFPYVLGASTASLMQDFDTDVYDTSSSSYIYRLIDAMAGSTGAGALLNQAFLNQLQNNLATTYGSDLDYFFGNIGFLPRSPSEQYAYNASTDLLTSPQWDEVRIKDAWYRARIKDFWQGCNLGGTPEGIRMIVQAAVACDCIVYELWRYIDDFGLTEDLGRSEVETPPVDIYGNKPNNGRNEVVVQPLKSSLSPQEFKLLRDMLARVMPVDIVVTISTEGLAVLEPVSCNTAAANSIYFQVEKMVTATPILSQLPAPEEMAIDLLPTQQWLFDAQTDPTLAPYANLNLTAQQGYYYLTSGGARSPIDSVEYGRLQPDGSVLSVPSYIAFDSSAQYTPWAPWPTADSPDNYPGGKYGLTPSYAPAINSDGTPYAFPWASQAAFVAAQIVVIESQGGNATATQFQLPIAAPNQSQIIFLPEYGVAYNPPGKDSTVSMNTTANRQVTESGTQGWTSTSGFVRS
jgi:hypothetical protein